MDERGVLVLLRREAETLGGQRRLARKLKISQSYLNDMIHGRRAVPERILAYLGLARETTIVARKG